MVFVLPESLDGLIWARPADLLPFDPEADIRHLTAAPGSDDIPEGEIKAHPGLSW